MEKNYYDELVEQLEEKIEEISEKYLTLSVKYQDVVSDIIDLRQQNLDAEEVIRVLCPESVDGIAKKYWEKYGKN